MQVPTQHLSPKQLFIHVQAHLCWHRRLVLAERYHQKSILPVGCRAAGNGLAVGIVENRQTLGQ